MRKRPFLLLACMFLAGILIKKLEAWYLLVPAGVIAVWAIRKEVGMRRFILGVSVCFMLASGIFRMGAEEAFRSKYLPKLYDGQEIRLVGEIVGIEEKSRCICYYLTDCILDRSSACVPCNDVMAYMSSDEYSIGQILVLKGKIALFEEAANEGSFDAANYYQSRKIDFGLQVFQVESVHGEGRFLPNALRRLKSRLRKSITSCGGADGVLSAMLLGEKSELDGEVKSLYQRAGISHILAISGLHVSLFGLGLYHFLRKIGLCYGSSAGMTAVVVIFYAMMTGGSVSTRRAVGMLLLHLLADVLGKSYDMLSALGILCILLLWENPFLLDYSGFQFSVAAILGIGITGPVLTEWYMQSGSASGKKRRGLAGNLWSSLGIQLTTLPLVAFYYFEIPVYAVLINIVVLAVVPYLLGLGAAAAVVGLWKLKLGALFMAPCNWILFLYEKLCAVTLHWPNAQLITGCPALWQLILYYGILAVVLCHLHHITGERKALKKKGSGRKQNFMCMAGFSLAIVILLFQTPKKSEITMLDVGQGDGIYLRTGDGISMFIDGGSSDVTSVGTYRILPFLKYNGVKQVSYWFVTHTDEDHISGLKEVLESDYEVEHLVFAGCVKNEEKTVELAKLAERHGTKICYMEAGDSLETKAAKLRCIYPSEEDGGSQMDCNDLCLVFLYVEGSFRGIFTGDISAEVEEKLAESGLCEQVTLYKVSHHGSKNSNSEAFLQGLEPEIAVISCGEDNRYGHPHKETLEQLSDVGSRVFTTPEYGQITIEVDKEVKIKAFRNRVGQR